MDLVTQIQGIGYSFVYGIVFTFMYHLIYSNLVKIKFKYLRYFLQICCGILFAGIYFTGLFFINEGVLRFYFLVALLFGLIIYQNYMHQQMMIVIYYINKAIDYVFFKIKEDKDIEELKKELENEVDLLNDDDYVTRYARENYVFTRDGEQVVILPDIDQEK